MLKKGSAAAFFVVLTFISSCASESIVNVESGTYRLKSAVLVNHDKISELTCSGEFVITLTKELNALKVQPAGNASCPAASPGSFIEVLGGDCEQSFAEMSPSDSGSHYSNSGADWSCASRSSAHLEFFLEGLTSTALRVVRRNTQVPALETEFIFTRAEDVL